MAIFRSRTCRRRHVRAAAASAALAALVLAIAGCAPLTAPPYAADYEALDRLEATRPGMVAVDKAQPTDPADRVNNVRMRSARLVSPSGSFAQYVEDAMRRDLGEISIHDPKAPTRIAVRILVNELDLGVMNGDGRMEAEIAVTRGGAQRLRKTYRAETRFDSGYANVVAVPSAQAAYPRLVRALLRQVYADPQFVAAIAP